MDLNTLLLIGVPLFVGAGVFLFITRPRSNSAKTAFTQVPQTKNQKIALPKNAGDILFQIKSLFEVDAVHNERDVQFRFVKGSKTIEMFMTLSLTNNSGYPVTVPKVAWDLWFDGVHIQDGLAPIKINIEPKSSRNDIVIRDVVYESKIASLSFLRSSKKPNCYIEGIVYGETGLGNFDKAFTLLNLNVSVNDEEAPKNSDEPTPVKTESSGDYQGSIDQLTGFFEKNFLDEMLQSVIDRNMAQKLPVSLAIIDIDDLKDVNGTYGELTGDNALKMVAEHVRKAVDGNGFAVRWAEDTFAMVIEACSLMEIQLLAEKIREAVEKETIVLNEMQVNITVSIGAATLTDPVDYKLLVKNAEDMLKFAKLNGKNRVGVNKRRILPPEEK